MTKEARGSRTVDMEGINVNVQRGSNGRILWG